MEFNSGLKGLHFFSNGWHYEMNAAEEASLKINHENCAALLESMVLTVTLTHYAFLGTLSQNSERRLLASSCLSVSSYVCME